MTAEGDPKNERRVEPTVGHQDDSRTDEDDSRTDDSPPAGIRERRKTDRTACAMAEQALVAATKAEAAATKASMVIDGHIEECARNYRDLTFVLKWVVGILGTGTLLIITALGAVAWALFEYILSNPRLLGP